MPVSVTSMNNIPDGYTTVTPWIISKDTGRVLEFIAAAFDGEELARMPNEDGGIGHAETRIGNAIVMAFDARPHWPATPCFLRLYVEDAKATFERALAAGAEAVTQPTELFWGDLVGRVRDPIGNLWWIQQRVTGLTPEEMASRAEEPQFVDAMRYLQSAELVRS